MAVFLVVPLQNTVLPQELERRIREIATEDNVMIPKERNYALISYEGLSSNLRDALNLTGQKLAHLNSLLDKKENSIPPSENEQILAMVVNLFPGNYNGFGPNEIWEWVNSHFVNTAK